MRKLAVFVEGTTEALFVERLVREVVGKRGLTIVRRRGVGGANSPRRFTELLAEATGLSPSEFYVLIVDAATDSRVASDVREQYDSLVRNGYSAIVTLQDVYPRSSADIPAIRKAISYQQKTKPVAPVNLLSVREIEAWFLAEHTHLGRIDAALSPELVLAKLGFDCRADDMALREHPAADLSEVYRLVGLGYRKRGSQIQRTVDAIDYAGVFVETASKFDDLLRLVGVLSDFISPPVS